MSKNKIYAKNNHNGDLRTLAEHIDDVMYVYNHLKENNIFEENLSKLLKLSILFHDLGKINIGFQNAILFKNTDRKQSIRHNILSPAYMKYDLIRSLDISEDEFDILIKAVVLHHGSYFSYSKYSPTKIQKNIYENIYRLLESKEYDFDDIKDIFEKYIDYDIGKNLELDNLEYDYFGSINEGFGENNDFRKKYILLKGYLNLCDHLGSYLLEKRNLKYFFDDLDIERIDNKLLNFIKEKLKKQNLPNNNIKFNEIQEEIVKHKDKDIILTQVFTSGGKTIADDRLKGIKKIYLVPNKVSAMSFYQDAVKKYGKENVGILHGEIHLFNTQEDDITKNDIELSKNIAKPYIVATVDQIVLSMLKYKNYEKIFSAIFSSRICLDECHLMNPRMFLIFIYFMEFAIKHLDIKFHLMTATLPKKYEDELNIRFLDMQNITNIKKESLSSQNKVEIKYINNSENKDISKLIKECLKENLKSKSNSIIENRVLIVLNTIDRVQNLYNYIKENEKNIPIENVKCLHSRMKFSDKQEKFEQIISQDNNIKIWICTQSVEIALDIDFPYMITDQSPMESFLQRIGRVNRHNKLENGKVYIIKNNYDFDIYEKELQKETEGILKKYIKKNNIFDLEIRNSISEQYYSSKKVQEYYNKEIDKAKEEIKNYYGLYNEDLLNGEDIVFHAEPYENIVNTKEDASKLFRNIEKKYNVYIKSDFEEYKKNIANAKDKEKIEKERNNFFKTVIPISKKMYWTLKKDDSILLNDGLNIIENSSRVKYEKDIGLYYEQFLYDLD